MIIKSADDKQLQIEVLEALLRRPDVSVGTRRRIEDEIRTVRAGVKGERDAAYEIDFHYRDRKSFVIIHDLRLEHDGRVAQIDHLILTCFFDVWVCETKAFAEGVRINEYGEWQRYGGGRAHGMASPVEQNKRHLTVLKSVFDAGLVPLPTRLGITLKPTLLSLVLVSNEARIDRPPGKAAAQVDGLERVIKCEQLVATIERRFDQRTTVGLMSKVVRPRTIEALARGLVALHVPQTFDWAARFGLPPEPSPLAGLLAPSSAPSATVAITPTRVDGDLGTHGRPMCGACGRLVSDAVVTYSRAHARLFDGRALCMDCQKKARRGEI